MIDYIEKFKGCQSDSYHTKYYFDNYSKLIEVCIGEDVFVREYYKGFHENGGEEWFSCEWELFDEYFNCCDSNTKLFIINNIDLFKTK